MQRNRHLVGLKNKKWVSLLAPTFFFSLILLAGCDWRELIKPQKSAKKSDEQAEKSGEPSGTFLTNGEKFAFHRWLVAEMQAQIFARPPRARAEIDGWANVLSQRGSIEGVYHGFVYSSEYAELEKGKAPTRAVSFFAKEMAVLDHPNAPPAAPEIQAASEQYAKDYMNAPVYSLKRVLGEKVMEEAKARKADKEKLAAWYAPFAARWAKEGIDFGAVQRNNDSEPFHFKWAQENNLGMIQWELLNRVHRLLNAYGGLVRAAPATAPVAAPSAASAPNPAGK